MRIASTALTLLILVTMTTVTSAQEPTQSTTTDTSTGQTESASGQPAGSAEPAPNPAVLMVNGDPIYAVEISMVMQTIQTQLEQRGETVDTTELAKVATQRAIEQKLLVQEARRFGITPDELQVARAAQAAEQQAGGRAILESKLKAAGSSYEQFLGVIREIETLRVFVEQQIKPSIQITEEQIAAFYEDNPELFEAEERVHAYHMIFIVRESADPETLAAVRSKAEAARERAATSGEDFTTVARELSEGPSGPTGGDLGWVSRGALVEPLSETVFGLKPGEVSQVVQSRFGFHVATITEHRPAGTVGFDEASDQIESLLQQQQATDTVGQLLETLVKTAKVENLAGEGGVLETGSID